MAFALVDWTTIALAAIGLAGSIVSAIVMVRVKRIEIQAAENARIAAESSAAAAATAKRYRRKRARKRKPPPHPDG